MEIEWLPLSFFGSIVFWGIFITLGLLMPFFVFLNTFTLGKVVRELNKINKYLELGEERRDRETFGQSPRPNE